MRFRENTNAQQMFSDVLAENGSKAPGMRIYTAHAGDWQFVISYDLLHNVWGASYQPKHPAGKRVSATPCENPRPGEGKFRQYETQREAEQACERKYRQLREDN